MKIHNYHLDLLWTGNKGTGTSNYRTYERSYQIILAGKPILQGSSDPMFRGDQSKHNPEELLLASLSSCHMLWYLHLCAKTNIVVVYYKDYASGTMTLTHDGSGYFSHVCLHPQITITDYSMVQQANTLHKRANKLCFIANSVNFTVEHKPKCVIQPKI